MAREFSSARRKKPVSQKRVAVVLASLIGTLTVSCGVLLLMENHPLPGSPQMMAATQQNWSAIATPNVTLQSDRWNYIIIYESGDMAASAASLAQGRVNEGGRSENINSARPAAQFHFVVDSADSRRGANDGELEIGSAWLEQVAGAPYAGWPDSRYYNFSQYKNAVGVCISADLNRTAISEQQTQTLLQLTTELQRRLNIPSQQVLFQWELVPNAARATPTQKEYAERFRQMLD
jgi:hypothetical protein